jgi:hypothetical protein
MNKSRFTTPNSSSVPAKPGLYKIYRNDGMPLKVGISENLRRRLMSNHRLSNTHNSTLACHMELDESLAPNYNFAQRSERRKFLENECYILWEVIEDKKTLKQREQELEKAGKFRYTGEWKNR